MTVPGLPNRQAALRKRQKAYKRNDVLTAVGVIFVGIAGVVGLILFVGLLLSWPVMVALGVWHSYFPQVPALGWLATFVSVVAVHAVFHAAKYEKAKE